MYIKRRTVLHTAVISAMGVVSLLSTTAASAASLVIDGQYELRILTTPTRTLTTYDGGTETVFTFGNQTSGWNSGFSTSGYPLGVTSQGFTDNNESAIVSTDWSTTFGPDAGPGAKGTSVIDGYAGLITFDIVNGTIRNATTFNVDTILGTIYGKWAFYIDGNDLSGFSGSIDATGEMTFTPTGRMAAEDGPAGGLVQRMVIDYGQGAAAGPWNQFSTGTIFNSRATMSGSACSGSAGNYACTLVSGGQFGVDFLTLEQHPYFEVWNTNLVRIGDASIVPVPAAAWLFGSGLVGLVGLARRKTIA